MPTTSRRWSPGSGTPPVRPADNSRRTPAQSANDEARIAVYSELMWPEWDPRTEAHGTSQEQAEQLLNAHAAEVRAAVLREAAEQIDTLPTGDCSDVDSHDEAWDWGARAAATELRRMADEETNR